MSISTIPLVAAPQILSIILAGVTYQLTFTYRNVDQGGWFMDFADAAGDNILTGIPLVTGGDLLAQYGYLDFGGMLAVQDSTNPDLVPSFTTLGDTCLLYWVTPN